MSTLETLALVREDLLIYEQRLRDGFHEVLPFEAHALYFPPGEGPEKAEWLPEEEKLLIPLRYEGCFLGVFMARRPDPELTSAALPFLPGITRICLDNVALCKRVRTDPLTGLSTGEFLLERITRNVEQVRARLSGDGGRPAMSGDPLLEGGPGNSLGLVWLRCGGLSRIEEEAGSDCAGQLLAGLARVLASTLPEGSLAARADESGLAIFLPDADRTRCEKVGHDLLRELENAQLSVFHPLTRRPLTPLLHVGCALYPQDMDGKGLRQPREQARLLLRRAQVAARVAEERTLGHEGLPRVLSYGRLLPEGGAICRLLPFSRLMVNLGSLVGARAEQHFSVWSPAESNEAQRLYKGEIVLLEVGESESLAEILHLGDPSWPLEAGDLLELLPPEQLPASEKTDAGDSAEGDKAEGEPGKREEGKSEDGEKDADGKTPVEGEKKPSEKKSSEEKSSRTRPAPGLVPKLEGGKDPLTGLWRHAEFLSRLPELCLPCQAFGLSLVHLAVNPVASAPQQGTLASSTLRLVRNNKARLPYADGPDRLMAKLAELCRSAFVPLLPSEERAGELAGGRFSLNSLIFFHPEVEPETLRAACAALSAEATDTLGAQAAVGMAVWPYLNFRQADMVDCVRKALDYALLLPPPHAGLFDSLAINISADKRHCRGDVFGAIEEYKLALLADDNNALAWNSLGVCMAGLGRRAEARHYFEEALRRAPQDAATAYNLGAVCQSLGDKEAAARHFQTCVELDPHHIYALVRLGQLAEAGGDREKAAGLYQKAASLDEHSSLPYRHLAHLDLQAGDREAAREHVHQALLRQPSDAVALRLMAAIYLESGDDPELAESLARRSVSQQPESRRGWLTLALALEKRGRLREAAEARLKAAD